MFLAKAFGVFFLISFGGGIFTYSLLALITKQLFGTPSVFGGLPRMFMYHEMHPFQYIALVAVVYSMYAAVWATLRSHSSGWLRWLEITSVLVLVHLTSSVLGGVLWQFHDMQAGYFPESSIMWATFADGAYAGLLLGPLIVLISIPINVMAVISGYVVTHKVPAFLKAHGG